MPVVVGAEVPLVIDKFKGLLNLELVALKLALCLLPRLALGLHGILTGLLHEVGHK
ncbi:hypothetical protein D3C83_291570 [compost metagenome]